MPNFPLGETDGPLAVSLPFQNQDLDDTTELKSLEAVSSPNRQGNFDIHRHNKYRGIDDSDNISSQSSDQVCKDSSKFEEPQNADMGNQDGQFGKEKANGVSSSSAFGNASSSGKMQSLVEHRRRQPSIDSSGAASPVARLLSQDSFSLEDELPTSHREDEGPSKGFFELSISDQRNFLLLVLLYFLQGVPMGLASGSVPFLLKSYLSYGQLGVFSLASYPYSLKLLWSPIVDAVWSPKVGRRKSWILPIQTISGFGMIWLGNNIDKMMSKAGENDGAGVWGFTMWWFSLVFMCATQDIAVDGMRTRNRCGHMLIKSRLGVDFTVKRKSFIRLNCSDSRAHSWPISVVYGVSRLQLPRFC